MTWFAASVIIGLRPTSSDAGPILAYENIVLVEAATSTEALVKARDYAKTEVSVEDKITVNERPVTKSLEGVRKLINISNPHPLDPDGDRPTSGTEITYSLFEVPNSEALEKLARGQEVTLRYVE
jgi:hypothetical protein